MGVKVVGAGGILGPSGRSGRPKLAAGQLESDGDVVGVQRTLLGKSLLSRTKPQLLTMSTSLVVTLTFFSFLVLAPAGTVVSF